MVIADALRRGPELSIVGDLLEVKSAPTTAKFPTLCLPRPEIIDLAYNLVGTICAAALPPTMTFDAAPCTHRSP